MSQVGTLEGETLKRKERLKALRDRKGGVGEPPEKKAANDTDSILRPIFRSYKPQDETLQEAKLPAPKLVNVEEHVQEQLEAAKPVPLVEEIDLVNLAPRKPDWDLKRDVAKKLEKLERRTQRAIAELIRDRLEESKDNQDLATAVDMKIQAERDQDDD